MEKNESPEVDGAGGVRVDRPVRPGDAIKRACVKPLFDLDVVYMAPYVNRLGSIDLRKLPRTPDGKLIKGRKCSQCGKPSGPFSVCREHREVNTVRRVIKRLASCGKLIRVTDGRGKRGGSLWRVPTDAA